MAADIVRMEIAETEAAGSTVKGSLDSINGRVVEGWAYDSAEPSRPLTIELFDRERRLGETGASLFRADLLGAAIGDGCHAFRFLLPLEIFDGHEHAIIAGVSESGDILHNSPIMLRTQQLPVQQAYPTSRAAISAAPPLSDFQFSMLRSLQAMTEALTVQSRALEALLGHLSRQLAPPPPPPPPLTEAELYGPLLAAAREARRGVHDYIVFSIIDWHFRIQRPQHLASRIAARGSRVFYLSVQFVEPDVHAAPFRIRSQPADGVFELTLTCRAPLPVIYAGLEEERQIEEISASLAAVVAILGIANPVGIMQFPAWYPIAVSVPGLTLIHDCLDHIAGFNNVSPRIVALEETLLAEADGVVVTSEYLAGIVGARRDCEIVRNGADTAYFSHPPESAYEPRKRPVIGYYGAIADWFDMEIVLHCARKHRNWHFVLIGATEGADDAAARKLPNVEFLGEKPYRELTHYLYTFDVCIIPFKLVELIQATNPVKIYEYLCAGKPVVATAMPELTLLPEGLVRLAKSPVDFERKIASALAEKGDAAPARRRAWAMRQSWSVRARAFEAVVARHSPRVSIVILCFNNLDFTRACLSSVLALSEYPDLEILCVDNASTDGTAEFLAQEAKRDPRVRPIRNKRNLGFAGGNNAGIRAATGEIVVLLNNDTYVTKGWVRDLIRPLLLDPAIGLAGPLTNMIGNEQKIAVNYANMGEMARVAAAFTARRRRQRYAAERLAFFCVAIRKDVFAKAGLLNTAYAQGFFEDDDFCNMARRAGYRLVICDDVFVHHHLSASFDQLALGEKAALMQKNKAVFEKRWGEWVPHRYRQEPGFGE